MKKKILAACLVICLLATAVIGTTLAYFTSDAKVTNTFTAGNVTITLDEAPVDGDGKATEGPRGTGNTYKLYPGKDYDKDPTIHVAGDSEDCYLFVKLENGLAGVEDQANTMAAQMVNNGWKQVEGNVYVYTNKGEAPVVVTKNTDLPVFSTFKIATDATAETLKAATDVVVTAYAIQAEGMEGKNAAELWAAGGWN